MADSTTVFAAKDESFSATVNRLQKSIGSFEGNLKTFNERAANIGKTFAGLAVKVAALGVAFLGVRGAVRSMGAAIELGGQLNDLSARTGETAGNLMILRRAFENAGAGAESVGMTINRLQRNIVEGANGAKAQAEAFDKLGLSAEDLKNKTPTEQLKAVARALRDVENDSERTNLSMLLLGRSGGELIPLFRAMDEELGRAAKQVGSAARIMDETNVHLDRISDNFKTLNDKSTDFAVGLLSTVAPALANITDRLSEIDAAAFGEQLSIYLKRTMDWAKESLKLGEALANVEVAIKGISAGNFGDGMKLLFLTARNAALDAINEIVASGHAAIKTIQAMLRELFAPNSLTVRYIIASGELIAAAISKALLAGAEEGIKAFAKIVPSYYRQLGKELENSFLGVLPGIAAAGRSLQKMADNFDASPISKNITSALSDAQDIAQEKINDLTMLMRADLGDLARDWNDAMSKVPRTFAESYEANMKQPLFDMTTRVAETADLMEKVAASTRAAAFDAQNFAEALRSAQIDRLAGNFPDSPFPANTRGGGANMSGTVIGTNAAVVASALSSAGRAQPAPQSNLDLLREAAKTDPRARAELMRLQNEQAEQMSRANDLRARGFFQAAAQAELRAERRTEQRTNQIAARELATEQFGGRNMGEAFRNFREDMQRGNMMSGMSQREFEDFYKEQAKSEREREREQQRAGGGKGGAGQKEQAVDEKIYQWLTSIFFKDFQERLPQHALT